MENQQDKKLFVLNGIQTLSGYDYNLMPEVADMEAIGVDIVRISPEPGDIGAQVEAMRAPSMAVHPPAVAFWRVTSVTGTGLGGRAWKAVAANAG